MIRAVAMVLLAGVLSWILTGVVRRYALAHSLLDHPNQRSSHTAPTPRGGGLAIVLVCCVGIGALAQLGWLLPRFAVALVGGGAIVAAIGWIDDHLDLSAHARAVAQFAGAAWAVAWVGGVGEITLGFSTLRLGWIGSALAVVGVVWLTNLYNFMDGIDGIAGGEAAIVGTLGGLLLFLHGQLGLALAAWIVAAASGGFLLWNWAPARIFMGDVGSGFLGFVFGVVALASEKVDAVPALGWLLLLGVFVFDATVTLGRRVLRGERWCTAHRKHAYQRAVQASCTHAQVSAAVVVVTLGLSVLAFVAQLRPVLLVPVICIGVLLLLAIYLRIERLRPFTS